MVAAIVMMCLALIFLAGLQFEARPFLALFVAGVPGAVLGIIYAAALDSRSHDRN